MESSPEAGEGDAGLEISRTTDEGKRARPPCGAQVCQGHCLESKGLLSSGVLNPLDLPGEMFKDTHAWGFTPEQLIFVSEAKALVILKAPQEILIRSWYCKPLARVEVLKLWNPEC